MISPFKVHTDHPDIVSCSHLQYIFMSQVLVYWNILSEESKTIKAVVDLLKINSKFVPFDYRQPLTTEDKHPGSQIAIRSYADLRKLSQMYPAAASFFGTDQSERAAVEHWLKEYEDRYRPLLHLPLQQYLPLDQQPIEGQKVTSRLRGMQQTLAQLDVLVSRRQTAFICTQKMSIVDILLYFNICNLVYFGRTHHKYAAIVDWFNQLYGHTEIKIITHQWFSLAKEISAVFRSKKGRPAL